MAINIQESIDVNVRIDFGITGGKVRMRTRKGVRDENNVLQLISTDIEVLEGTLPEVIARFQAQHDRLVERRDLRVADVNTRIDFLSDQITELNAL